ncbi:hypothetical protein F5Y04DRAFT_284431 [Hypomontagnella monticulosa]|nr:hypothetical protein F5Y04DRAFT_284431 [Hypomontagnella monticulosa]
MRSLMLLVLATLFCAVGADWFRWPGGSDNTPSWTPQETGRVVETDQIGWTPKPTPAPGIATPDNERVLDLLRRDNSTTEWTNSQTCGWMPSVSSEPFTCEDGATCETNSDHIVACVSGTASPFYSVCLNYEAHLSSSCVENGHGTGCCMDSSHKECATYLWTDQPQRSLYRCFSTSTVFTMLDVPQFMADASTSSAMETQTHSPETDSRDTDIDKPVPSHMAKVGTIVGATIGSVVAFLLIACCVISIHSYRKDVKQEHRKVKARLDRAFRYTATPEHWTMAPQAPAPAQPSQAAQRYTPVSVTIEEPSTPTHRQGRRMSAYDSMGNRHRTPTPRTRAASASDVHSEAETPPPAYSSRNPFPDATPATRATPAPRTEGRGMRRYGFGAQGDRK